MDLGLTQKAVGAELGANPETLRNWELGHTEMAVRFYPPSAGKMLEFSRPAGDRLALHGRWESDSIDVQLRRVDESQFLLLNRGFHWIQPYPFFR